MTVLPTLHNSISPYFPDVVIAVQSYNSKSYNLRPSDMPKKVEIKTLLHIWGRAWGLNSRDEIKTLTNENSMKLS